MIRYNTRMNYIDFLDSIKNSKIIAGNYDFNDAGDNLMDLEIENKIFEAVEIRSGDFCSSTFLNCQFKGAVFIKSNMVGVSFHNCAFEKCSFINIDPGMSMKDCKISELIITRKEI